MTLLTILDTDISILIVTMHLTYKTDENLVVILVESSYTEKIAEKTVDH